MQAERGPARGLYSNVTLNLTSEEAVALDGLIAELRTRRTWTDALRRRSETPAQLRAVEKVARAAERARIPWRDRT